MQRVEDGEEVEEGQVQGPPGEQSEAPGEAEQEDEASHAAQVCDQAPLGGLVVGVLPLDAGQLGQHHGEHHQAQYEDDQEVRHHPDVERNVVPQPAARGRQRIDSDSFNVI